MAVADGWGVFCRRRGLPGGFLARCLRGRGAAGVMGMGKWWREGGTAA